MADENNNITFFLAGMGVGALIGLLFAPKSGAETRQLIGAKSRELADSAGEYYSKGRETATEYVGKGKEAAAEYYDKGREAVARGRDTLREAVSAGKQAYRDAANNPET